MANSSFAYSHSQQGAYNQDDSAAGWSYGYEGSNADGWWQDANGHWQYGYGCDSNNSGSAWGWSGHSWPHQPEQQDRVAASASVASSATVPRVERSTGTAIRDRFGASCVADSSKPRRIGQQQRVDAQPRRAAASQSKPAVAAKAVLPLLTLRLKIVDSLIGVEQQREVSVDRTSTVRAVKQSQFGEALSQGARLRIMFMGQELADSSGWSKVPDNSFLQCFLVRVKRPDEITTKPSSLASGKQHLEEEFEADGETQTSDLALGQASEITPTCKTLMFGACMMCAWGFYLATPEVYGDGCRVALTGASLAWVVVSGSICAQRSVDKS